MKILLDTNFLIYCVENRIEIKEELNRVCDFNYEVYVLDKSVDELKKLKKDIILKIMDKKGFQIIKTHPGNTDDLIVNIVDRNFIVGTHDRVLKKRLKAKKIKMISVRQKKYFSL